MPKEEAIEQYVRAEARTRAEQAYMLWRMFILPSGEPGNWTDGLVGYEENGRGRE